MLRYHHLEEGEGAVTMHDVVQLAIEPLSFHMQNTQTAVPESSTARLALSRTGTCIKARATVAVILGVLGEHMQISQARISQHPFSQSSHFYNSLQASALLLFPVHYDENTSQAPPL
jgi:hypothetical protein